MIKVQTILAGTAIAVLSHVAIAQSVNSTTTTTAPIDTSNPAYTDQSRANQYNDPYVKKRVAVKEAKEEYKADKSAAKQEFKEDKQAAKREYKDAKREAVQTRKAELSNSGTANVESPEPATSSSGR